jgi:cysteine synthase A
MGPGTGGTLSGTATFLRRKNPQIRVILADPEGSGLFNKVKYGVMFDIKEREGRKRRHQVDTIVSQSRLFGKRIGLSDASSISGGRHR